MGYWIIRILKQCKLLKYYNTRMVDCWNIEIYIWSLEDQNIEIFEYWNNRILEY